MLAIGIYCTQDMESIESEDREKIPIWQTKRYQVAALFFVGCILQSSLKYNLSIAIVCMVKHQPGNTTSSNDTRHINTTNSPTDDMCIDEQNYVNSSGMPSEEGEFDWSKTVQGLLLGGMFWGFLSGQIMCGWLGQRYGARTVMGLGIGGGALLTLLTPTAARLSPYLLLAVRVAIGLSLACVYPNLVGFWTRWAPPEEYSRMMGLSLSGSTLGNAIVFPVGGLLCGEGDSLGWPSVFYITGGTTLCWSVLWIILVRDNPSNTPGITHSERKFLERCMEKRGYRNQVQRTPWLSMLTSGVVIALVITHFLGNYCLYMLFTLIPTYLHDVLRVDIRSNGLFSMLPLICTFAVTNVCGQVADYLISRHICAVGTTRKIFNTIGCVVPSALFVALSYIGCENKTLAVAVLCLAAGFVGFNCSGHIINYGDIAFVYGGILSGLGNTFSSLSGVVAPYLVAKVTPNGSQEEWQIAFFIAAGAFGLAAAIFLIFGTGDIQPWALPDTPKEETVQMDDDEINENTTRFNIDLRDSCT